MNIQEIAAAHWSKREPNAALADLVQTHLSGRPDNAPPIGTTALVLALLPNPDDKQMKSLVGRLYTLRKEGTLDGYFTRGKKGPTGHPLVHWKAEPVEAVSDDCSGCHGSGASGLDIICPVCGGSGDESKPRMVKP